MGRGIFFGLIWGGLVSVLGLTAASILADPPSQTPRALAESAAEEPDAQASAETENTSQDTTETALATPTPAPVPAPAPMGVAQPEAPVADTSPLALPEVGVVGAAPESPVVEEETIASVAEEEPVLPSPQAVAPTAVDEESAPVAETEVPVAEPAEPAEPEVSTDEPPVVASESPEVPQAPQVEVTAAAEAPDTVTPAPPGEEIIIAEAAPAPPVPNETVVEAPQISTDVAAPPAPSEPATDVAEAAEPEASDATPTTENTNAEAQPAAAPRISLQSEQGGSFGQRVGTFGDRARNVETNRLPTISNGADDTAQAEPAAVTEVDPDAPPLTRFAAAWENPEARPIMSILLIDDGAGLIEPELMGSFPYPVTVAVKATDPNAADRVAQHRAFGFEVLALADLPRQAAPSDIEVGLEASLANVPEATGVLVFGDVPGGRQGTAQIIEKLGQSGYGLVTASSGLNMTEQLADSTGFPAANIFDDLDGDGQTATVMRRFLDNAAFRAGQGQDVIMLGRMRPETISVLIEWGQSDRANRVALVPVSAVLTAE